MVTENFNAEMLKGHLELVILAALEKAPAHGYEILSTLAGRSLGLFDLPEGTVYPALHRMEQAGLLQSAWSVVDGRRRRVYSLTSAGRTAKRARLQAWHAFAQAVNASVADSAHGYA